MTEGFYRVGELSELSKVSVRTLRFYDTEGLLQPCRTTESGYRLYGRAELIRLQQILFFREIGMPLREIRNVLDRPDFERETALRNHRTDLEHRIRKLRTLIRTIDLSLEEMNGGRIMTDRELYDGFDVEAVLDEQKQYEAEVDVRFDPVLVEESRRRTSKYSKEDWGRILAEGNRIFEAIAGKLRESVRVDAAEVQDLVKRHHAYIDSRFYSCSKEVYAGLGEMYRSDERFRAYYERICEGLADYLSEAIRVYTTQ